MSAYNTVAVQEYCPHCQADADIAVQFKYGDTWQYTYHIGDALRWGGNDVGQSGVRRVVVDGVAEACPRCHKPLSQEPDYYVYLENDKIVTVQQSTGEHDFLHQGQTYLELPD